MLNKFFFCGVVDISFFSELAPLDVNLHLYTAAATAGGGGMAGGGGTAGGGGAAVRRCRLNQFFFAVLNQFFFCGVVDISFFSELARVCVCA